MVRVLAPRSLRALMLAAACMLGACGGVDDPRPAAWSFISVAIVQPSCASATCHSKLSERSGVRLDGIDVGYEQLVCRHFVIGPPDTDWADSALLALLRGQGSRRMPPDVPLPNADIKLIETWISNGATWDGAGSNPCPPTTPDGGP
jgi:hypothetical protein